MAAKKNRQRTSSKKSKPKHYQSWPKALLRLSLLAIGIATAFLFILFGAVYIGLFGKLPSADDLKAVKNDNASEIFSADNVLLGKYFVKNRSSVAFADIPQIVINALVSTEDNRFFEHEGIDFYSIPRVVLKTVILRDRSGGGGSTISQQFVKNMFGRKSYGPLSVPVNKLKENITALKLEEIYSKEEIITLYLNTVSFGENVYGLKAASQRYFNKNPSALKVEEAATLVGMLKATTSYNPRLHPEASLQRRNTVMALMVREGHLDVELFTALQNKPLKIDYKRLEGQFGPAPYLRAYIEPMIKTLLEKKTKPDGSTYNLYSDGLRIETTLNSRLQEHAEASVRAQLKQLQKSFDKHWEKSKPWGSSETFLWGEAKKSNRYLRLQEAGKAEAEIKQIFRTPTNLLVYNQDSLRVMHMSPLDSVAFHQLMLQTGLLAMDAKSGDVLAYVGGIDFGFFPYDHVFSRRQVGSTFKPFVYATALESGISPCDYFENEQMTFSDYEDWSPENSNGTYGGYYSVKGGLTYSVNTIAARLMASTGVEQVRAFARKAGIKNYLPKVPALALGVADLSLMEMTTAYSVFANRGRRVSPTFIKAIYTSDGKSLYTAPKSLSTQIVDPFIASEMRAMLEMVVDSGTARSAKTKYGIRAPLAGKTGTTQNNADGWFMCFTPRIVCGAWVGAQSPIVRFRSTALGQGAATALPVAASFLRSAERDPSLPNVLGRSFPEEPGLSEAMDCPLWIESKVDNFFDDLFGRDPTEAPDADRDTSETSPDKGGWINRLLDKLKDET